MSLVLKKYTSTSDMVCPLHAMVHFGASNMSTLVDYIQADLRIIGICSLDKGKEMKQVDVTCSLKMSANQWTHLDYRKRTRRAF